MNVKTDQVRELFVIIIYIFCNSLFVYKYISRITIYPSIVLALYIVCICLFIALIYGTIDFNVSTKLWNIIYPGIIIVSAVCLTAVMLRFDPSTIRVGRYPAIQDWLSRLLQGEFPYSSETKPSGFPFLFALVFPFYLLGDSGLFQIFAFVIFSVLLYIRHNKDSFNSLCSILLLLASPMFLYEIVVRSELFSNMVIVMLFLSVFTYFKRKINLFSLVIFGIAGGFLLSTRGVVLLIYLIFFGYYFKNQKHVQTVTFTFSMAAGFLITLIPFMVWDKFYFLNNGPFAVQMSYITPWMLILAVAVSILCASIIESEKTLYFAAACTLFGVVLVSFLLMINNTGWHGALIDSDFDISYFAFALPFLLFSLDFTQNADHSLDAK